MDSAPLDSVQSAQLHSRARTRGVNPFVYWPLRAILQPFFHLYFRYNRIGREHLPASGPMILAANHRSFLDPFVIGTLVRRPVYYVAKKELFQWRWLAWLLNALGAFPVDRGGSDEEMIATAHAILGRGDCLVIFPEGTRTRPGTLGEPKRGVGRLALESGAPIVPVAVIGTEEVRRGWRIRPHKVRLRCGPAITFPRTDAPTPALAAAVTGRIWPCVMLQWERLGGVPPLRRAAIVGAGAWGTALAVMLARAGVDVELGCRNAELADELESTRRNERHLPDVALPSRVRALRASDLDFADQDLVCFAVPTRSLRTAVAAYGERIPAWANVLVAAKGLVPPLGTLPTAYVAERVHTSAVGCLGGPAHAADALLHGASMVLGTEDRVLGRLLGDVLRRAGFDVHVSSDVTGVELAGAAKNAAALAAAAAAVAGPNAAGAAAGKVFAEVEAYARLRGAQAHTFSGLAGTGDLVATVLAANGRNRRAGELLGAGVPAAEIPALLGRSAEAVDFVPLLHDLLRGSQLPAPAVEGLADLIAGRLEPERWSAAITAPPNMRAA
ncbi:MAG: 1-acylglycerol-3-phosphate O-acyltransferase [Actinomycetota bacterium]|nr:1-acylglycerol-3-phosphate O-acyltransferase [Actinomycetota bacterium]